jgi:hypothetical protein
MADFPTVYKAIKRGDTPKNVNGMCGDYFDWKGFITYCTETIRGEFDYDESPLTCALMNGDFEMMKFLIGKGFSLETLEMIDGYYCHILEFVEEMKNRGFLREHLPELVKIFEWYFAEGGGDMNFVDDVKNSYFHYFVKTSVPELVYVLLEMKAKIPTKNISEFYFELFTNPADNSQLLGKLIQYGFPVDCDMSDRMPHNFKDKKNLINYFFYGEYSDEIQDLHKQEYIEILILHGFDIHSLSDQVCNSVPVQNAICKYRHQSQIGLYMDIFLADSVPLGVLTIICGYAEEGTTHIVEKTLVNEVNRKRNYYQIMQSAKRSVDSSCENCKKKECCCAKRQRL